MGIFLWERKVKMKCRYLFKLFRQGFIVVWWADGWWGWKARVGRKSKRSIEQKSHAALDKKIHWWWVKWCLWSDGANFIIYIVDVRRWFWGHFAIWLFEFLAQFVIRFPFISDIFSLSMKNPIIDTILSPWFLVYLASCMSALSSGETKVGS